MARSIPEPLRDHILARDWDVRRAWTLETEAQVVPLQRLTYLLELPLWSSVPGRGMLFDLCPADVLADPNRCPRHTRRIEDADLAYPLDFALVDGRAWILDGVHRIARASELGLDTVRIRQHHERALADIWL